MKVHCPNDGLVEVAKGLKTANSKNVIIRNMIVQCPSCGKRFIIEGTFNFDENDVAARVDERVFLA